MTPPRNPYVFTRAEYDAHVKRLAHPFVSERSDYEEIELVEDCTLYDIYRQPRAPVTDPSVTRTLPVRELNADLTCPICLSIIRQTEVVMECLHRFCGECIHRSLRVGKNECPSCRMHIPSKRSLRRDANFDELITKIYPNLDEFTRQEEKLIAEINRERHCNNALTESTKMGVQNQQTLRRNGGKKKLDEEENGTSSASSSASSSPDTSGGEKRALPQPNMNGSSGGQEETAHKKPRVATNGDAAAASNGTKKPAPASTATKPSAAATDDDEKVNIRMVLHPKEANKTWKLERSLFRTSYSLKIRHLKSHLVKMLKLPSAEGLRIVLSSRNCALSGLSSAVDSNGHPIPVRKDLNFDQELEDHVTLYDIYQQYDMGTKWELQLYYHFSDSIVNGVAQFLANAR